MKDSRLGVSLVFVAVLALLAGLSMFLRSLQTDTLVDQAEVSEVVREPNTLGASSSENAGASASIENVSTLEDSTEFDLRVTNLLAADLNFVASIDSFVRSYDGKTIPCSSLESIAPLTKAETRTVRLRCSVQKNLIEAFYYQPNNSKITIRLEL